MFLPVKLNKNESNSSSVIIGMLFFLASMYFLPCSGGLLSSRMCPIIKIVVFLVIPSFTSAPMPLNTFYKSDLYPHLNSPEMTMTSPLSGPSLTSGFSDLFDFF